MKYIGMRHLLKKSEVFIIIISLGLGVLFGVIDSLVSAYFFYDGDILGQIFISDYNVIWKRSLVLIIVLINGLIIIKLLRSVRAGEEKLHESREIFKNVFEFSATGIALADLKGNFIRVNSSFSKITGYAEEELLRTNFRSITHPEDLEADLMLLRQLQNNEISYFSMEKRYLHRNGSYIWVLLNVSTIRNTEGRQLYYVAHIQNISDRKESSFMDISEREKAVYEKNRAFQELNQIFNTIGIGLCLIDTDNNIARINDSYLKLFRKKREDVIGRKCHEIMHESICLTEECPLAKILSGEKSCEFESRKVVDEGGALTLIVTANPFLSPDGNIQGIILSFTDITENRKLEKSIVDISEQERLNLGQLLHDELGQLLTGLTFRAEALKSIMEEKSYPEAPDAGDMAALIKKIHLQIRRIMIGLYPVNVQHDRLLVALNDLASETERLFPLKCTIVNEGNLSISDYSDITQLLYIAKESVHNAVKHATPGKITLTLSEKDGMFSMDILNDGEKGKDVTVNKNGLGLRIMQYRAKLIGAKFEQRIDNGTFRVRVSKPLGKKEGRE